MRVELAQVGWLRVQSSRKVGGCAWQSWRKGGCTCTVDAVGWFCVQSGMVACAELAQVGWVCVRVQSWWKLDSCACRVGASWVVGVQSWRRLDAVRAEFAQVGWLRVQLRHKLEGCARRVGGCVQRLRKLDGCGAAFAQVRWLCVQSWLAVRTSWLVVQSSPKLDGCACRIGTSWIFVCVELGQLGWLCVQGWSKLGGCACRVGASWMVVRAELALLQVGGLCAQSWRKLEGCAFRVGASWLVVRAELAQV